MKKTRFIAAALLLAVLPASAENGCAINIENDSIVANEVHAPLNKNYDASTDKRNKDLTKTYVSVGYQFFFDSDVTYVGVAARLLNWEGLGAELGFRTKVYKNNDDDGAETASTFFSIDPLANYNYGLYHKNLLSIYATGTIGPSFRIQNLPNGQYKDNGKMDYDSKVYFDLFVNARVTVKYWNIAASVGYSIWATQWKLKSDYIVSTPNVSIAYCF